MHFPPLTRMWGCKCTIMLQPSRMCSMEATMHTDISIQYWTPGAHAAPNNPLHHKGKRGHIAHKILVAGAQLLSHGCKRITQPVDAGARAGNAAAQARAAPQHSRRRTTW